MWRKVVGDEKGSVMVMVVLGLVLLIGFTGLVIDGGRGYLTKAKLQTAADAAALAGAKDLPSAAAGAKVKAIEYAQKNGMKSTVNGVVNQGDTVTVTSPYDDNPYDAVPADPTKIEVWCTRTIGTPLLSVLGFSDSTVRARAVGWADFTWSGEALPFLNVNNNYEEDVPSSFSIWNKVSDGFFSVIHSDDYTEEPSVKEFEYFDIKYEDGIIPKDGQIGDLSKELDVLWDRCGGQTVYIFSLAPSVITLGTVDLAGHEDWPIINLNKIPMNGNPEWNILPDQIVLLECVWETYEGFNIGLTYTGTSYDLKDEFPLDYEGPPSIVKPRLIQ